MQYVNKTITTLLLLAAAPTALATCPAQDISFFIQRFSNDEAIQRLFTVVPLVSQYLDAAAQPEPERRTRTLERGQIVFPVMPLAEERSERLLGMRLEDVTALSARVDLFKPDTDYLISYFFRMDDCWRLVKIDHQSL